MPIKTITVDAVEVFDYEGDVYNIELVSNDENPLNDDLFWIDGESGLVTHNCFPKDLNAIVHLCKNLGITPSVLRGVWEKNIEVRDDRDWEKMKGRAVSEE